MIEPDLNVFAPLGEYLRQWVGAVPTGGVAIAVTDRRRTLYQTAMGYADLGSGRPALLGDRFQIGSIGKSMTALALLQLVGSGRLELDAPIGINLPWFAIPSRHGPITLRHLLSHTAGLPAGSDFAPAARYEGFALRDTGVAWEPGSRYHYSNTGYKLLGWLLEDLSGLGYGEVMRRRILEPLGMGDTHPVITHATHRDSATGYVPLRDDRPYRRNDTLIPATWIEYAVADGSQVSTASDMARYARVWLNGGRGETGALVSPQLFREAITPAISMSEGGAFPPGYNYGFGIIIHEDEGHRFIGHGGSTVGFRSIMLTDQTDGLGVVMLCNGSDVNTHPPARHALRFAAAVGRGETPPDPPAIPDPTRVENGERYAGVYTDEQSGSALSVSAQGGGLALHRAGHAGIVLEHVAGNTFCVPHDDFDPFPLRFRGRASDGDDGPTVEIRHGSRVYVREGHAALESEAISPPEWAAYPGQYRSHSPYFPNIRVVMRRGRLYLAWPHGGEDALTPYAVDGGRTTRFAVGPPGEPTAEWIQFDSVAANRALRMRWAGGGRFYRV